MAGQGWGKMIVFLEACDLGPINIYVRNMLGLEPIDDFGGCDVSCQHVSDGTGVENGVVAILAANIERSRLAEQEHLRFGRKLLILKAKRIGVCDEIVSAEDRFESV